MKIERNPPAWHGPPPSLLGWWRVLEDDGSTVAYVPDEATARKVAGALMAQEPEWVDPPCGWTCRVHLHGTESRAPCEGDGP